jgi:triacylglycerol esterase/lipase EstA (alpha/beta hydrolase family)
MKRKRERIKFVVHSVICLGLPYYDGWWAGLGGSVDSLGSVTLL